MAAFAAALVLAIGMAFGRFAFTGLFPLMVADGQLSVAGGSYAAAANYAGYLAGALALSALPRVSGRGMCVVSTFTTAALLAFVGLASTQAAIVLLRGAAGIASALAMVGAAQWLLQELGRHDAAARMFSGVGAGVTVSAELIAATRGLGLSSASIWLVLAGASAALALIAAATQARAGAARAPAIAIASGAPDETPMGASRLIALYGLAGFGYIITATYLPLMARAAIAIDPLHVWAVFGLGAAPSCFFWQWLHARRGTGFSLLVNLLVQAGGVGLALLHHPAAYVASAFLVGGTFVGVVTIALPAARRTALAARFNIMAVMTASYGVGQIAGPLAADALYRVSGDFDAALLAAVAALCLGAGLCLGSRSPAG